MTYYTTLTSKGQITLPAAFRRRLKMHGGQRISVRMGSNNQVIIETPLDLQVVQERTREYLERHGFTPEKLRAMAQDYTNGDGMSAAVQEKYGKS